MNDNNNKIMKSQERKRNRNRKRRNGHDWVCARLNINIRPTWIPFLAVLPIPSALAPGLPHLPPFILAANIFGNLSSIAASKQLR